jgi:hypothetical protein
LARILQKPGAVAAAAAAALVIAASAWAAGFTIVPTPNPGTTNTIDGLVAFSPSEIWAIGNASSSSYAGCHGRTLTARWNGSAFVEVPAPATPICASIGGVAGLSTTNIWAVGSTNNGRDTHIRHWDGSAWSVVAGATIALPPSGGRAQRSTGFNGVAAVSANDIWAVGRAQFADFSRRGLTEHWNGSAWQLVSNPAPNPSILYGVAAFGSSNVWAVGASGGSTFAMRWNGSSWKTVATPNADVINSLRGVAGVAATDIWAVGSSIRSTTDGVSASHTLIEHWNGTSWTIVPSPNVGAGGNALLAVAARSANEVWAVGYYDDVAGSIPIRRTLVLKWDGTRWTRVASPNAGTGDNTLTAVVTPSGTTDVWASGGSADGTLVEHYTQ